ncbi:MAG: hypothetical protein ACLP0A_10025 [Verrucomicrobiia bacterium]
MKRAIVIHFGGGGTGDELDALFELDDGFRVLAGLEKFFALGEQFFSSQLGFLAANEFFAGGLFGRRRTSGRWIGGRSAQVHRRKEAGAARE